MFENSSLWTLSKEFQLSVRSGRNVRPPLPGMPVVGGCLGGKAISVLRDNGCDTVIVREYVVTAKKFTSEIIPVLFLDRTVMSLPEAEIEVKTLFFSGILSVNSMNDPLYDLVVGNVEGLPTSIS